MDDADDNLGGRLTLAFLRIRGAQGDDATTLVQLGPFLPDEVAAHKPTTLTVFSISLAAWVSDVTCREIPRRRCLSRRHVVLPALQKTLDCIWAPIPNSIEVMTG